MDKLQMRLLKHLQTRFPIKIHYSNGSASLAAHHKDDDVTKL